MFDSPNPAGQGTKVPSIVFFGVQACRLPALKPSKCLFGNPNPASQGTNAPSIAFSWRSNNRLPALKPSKRSAGQGTKAPSIAFSWRSSLPFASPQTLQMPFWQPQPRRPRHQGPINSFFLAFKPAVCQPSIKPASVVSTEGGVGGTRALAHSIKIIE